MEASVAGSRKRWSMLFCHHRFGRVQEKSELHVAQFLAEMLFVKGCPKTAAGDTTALDRRTDDDFRQPVEVRIYLPNDHGFFLSIPAVKPTLSVPVSTPGFASGCRLA